MNISKKALALFAGSAVAIGGVASIGAQAFAQTSAVPTVATHAAISTPAEVTGLETKDAPEAPGAPDVQVGHQDPTGTDSTSAQ